MTTNEVKYLVFDTETTGIDTENDRIVQMFIGLYDENAVELERYEWFINPGVEVPEEAANVHGFTTEFLRENGVDPHQALGEIDWVFKEAVREGWTIVAFNLNFDLSILTREMARHNLETAYGQRLNDNSPLFDPLVVDRAKDKYRKGKRTLEAMCGHYGIGFNSDEAHDASYDVAKTAEVAVAVAGKYGVPSNAQQATWYRDWAEGLESYLRRTDESATVNRGWPYREKEE